MATKLTDNQKRLRREIVEILSAKIKADGDLGVYTPEEVSELVKQTERIAKFLGLVK